jgi:hypothetical protein
MSERRDFDGSRAHRCKTDSPLSKRARFGRTLQHRLSRLLGTLAVWGGLGSLALAAPSAHAQATPAAADKGDLDRQYDAAFQEMLKQPANLDVLFKFATIGSQNRRSRGGDLDARAHAAGQRRLAGEARALLLARSVS